MHVEAEGACFTALLDNATYTEDEVRAGDACGCVGGHLAVILDPDSYPPLFAMLESVWLSYQALILDQWDY